LFEESLENTLIVILIDGVWDKNEEEEEEEEELVLLLLLLLSISLLLLEEEIDDDITEEIDEKEVASEGNRIKEERYL
jgi:hypothetical protein